MYSLMEYKQKYAMRSIVLKYLNVNMKLHLKYKEAIWEKQERNWF